MMETSFGLGRSAVRVLSSLGAIALFIAFFFSAVGGYTGRFLEVVGREALSAVPLVYE